MAGLMVVQKKIHWRDNPWIPSSSSDTLQEPSPRSHLSLRLPGPGRSTRDLSLAMLLLFAAGILLWTAYGIWTNSPPIIAANVVTFFLVLLLLGMKIRYH
jgi:hypothetical protein